MCLLPILGDFMEFSWLELGFLGFASGTLGFIVGSVLAWQYTLNQQKTFEDMRFRLMQTMKSGMAQDGRMAKKEEEAAIAQEIENIALTVKQLKEEDKEVGFKEIIGITLQQPNTRNYLTRIVTQKAQKTLKEAF